MVYIIYHMETPCVAPHGFEMVNLEKNSEFIIAKVR
jgi:hypothetical protein